MASTKTISIRYNINNNDLKVTKKHLSDIEKKLISLKKLGLNIKAELNGKNDKKT